MKFRVKLKATVTAWVDVTVDDAVWVPADTDETKREWAACEGVNTESEQLRKRLTSAGLEHGPIELAYEELDESVQVIA